MATKLNAKQITDLKALKISATTQEEAKKKLISSIEEEGIEGEVIQDEPIESLIEMLKELKASSTKQVKEEEEEEEEEELDELSNELEEEEEEEDEEEEDEEEEEPVVKVKKTSSVVKATPKVVVKKEEKKTNVVDTKKAKVNSSSFDKFNPREDKKHLAYLKPFQEIFPQKEYQIDLLKNGFTVRLLTKNAKTTIMNFDELKIVDGELFGNFYTNRFKSVEDLLKVIGEEDYADSEIGMFRGESHPCIRKMSQEQVFSILQETEFISISKKRATGIDERMSTNRQKLESKLSSTPVVEQKKPVVTTTPKKKITLLKKVKK